MDANTHPVSLPHQARLIAIAGVLSFATLVTALLPTLKHVAAPAQRIIDLPRVLVAGVHVAAGAAVSVLPRVVVAGRRTASDTSLAVKKAPPRA